MDYLTIAEASTHLGLSRSRIQQMVSAGVFKTEPVKNSRNKTIHAISIDQFDCETQQKYYESKGIMNKSKEVKHSEQLEEMTSIEREECEFWEKIIKEWQLFRNKEGVKSKAQVDELFVNKIKLEYPDIKISTDILYRKYNCLKQGNLKGLIDKRGKAKKGCTKIDEETWQVFLSFFLDQAKHPQRKCYEYTKLYLQEHDKYDLLNNMPAYCTFTRHIKNDVSDAIKTLGRDGEKAFDDRCAPYIKRTYDNMESNDYWIGDNHTIDVIVGEGNSQFRLYLTGFMDARSGVITCIYITDTPSSQASNYSLRRGIKKYGIPKNVYLDNGREFLTFDFGGLGHRAKKNDDRYSPPPILERLGINMVNALVRNAKAKVIERRFLDFKNQISKLFATYTGGNVVEKPEILKVELKNGNIPDKQTFIKEIEELIEYYLNYETYDGAVTTDKGKRKIDVYYENLHTKTTATDEQLNLMMLRSTRPQKVTRRGVSLKISGTKIDYFNNELIMQMLNKQVYLRYDPDDLSKVRIYDLDDRFVMEVEADNTAVLEYGASKEDVKKAMAKTRAVKKATKEALKNSVVANIDRNTALELVLKKAEENKKSKVSDSKLSDIQIRKSDEKPLLHQIPMVDLEKMNVNSMRRGGYDNAN